ncbi:MAG: antitoxin VapB family protein [Candidatus Heimdallarchaeota archaeon]
MTTIHVRESTWKFLNSMKHPGESMDDVVNRLIEAYQQLTTLKGNISTENSGEDLDALLQEFCTINTDELQKTIEASRKSFALLGESDEKDSA